MRKILLLVKTIERPAPNSIIAAATEPTDTQPSQQSLDVIMKFACSYKSVK